MRNLAVLVSTLLWFILSTACNPTGTASRDDSQDIPLYNHADMVHARELSDQGVEPFATALDSLKIMADKAMMLGPFSVGGDVKSVSIQVIAGGPGFMR